MSKQQPFMPLFFGDLLGATPTWEGEERGLYVLLLAYQWTSGPLPSDLKRLARMCQYDSQNFLALWKTVGQKFITTGSGLVNERLEQHRLKSVALSKKNSTSGAKGAKSRWGNDSERNGDCLGECHNEGDGDCERSAIASQNGIPSHPIPSDPKPSATAPTGLSRSEAPATERDVHRGTHSADDRYELIVKLQAIYPKGTYSPVTWTHAERALGVDLDNGVDQALILCRVEDFLAQQKALGNVGGQFVPSPKTFFEERRWQHEFPLPAPQAKPRKETASERIERALQTREGRILDA